jgi:hypothetical protein
VPALIACPALRRGRNPKDEVDLQHTTAGFPASGRFWRILLKKSKSTDPKNLAKVDLRASLLLYRQSACLRGPVRDFG